MILPDENETFIPEIDFSFNINILLQYTFLIFLLHFFISIKKVPLEEHRPDHLHFLFSKGRNINSLFSRRFLRFFYDTIL